MKAATATGFGSTDDVISVVDTTSSQANAASLHPTTNYSLEFMLCH